MHPRLHRQKLQSKTNRGKTFRSLKNKAAANIEVIRKRMNYLVLGGCIVDIGDVCLIF